MKTIVVAVGNVEYLGADFADIPCAANDAVNIYYTLKAALGADFDEARSCAASNLTAHEFRSLVESKAREVGSRECLVLYFSGHGEVKGDHGALVFCDADAERRGRIEYRELSSMVRLCRSVVILDCCQAGAASGIANRLGVFGTSDTSVLSSAPAHSTSLHSEDGSSFTNSLCRQIETAAFAGLGVTLNQLAGRINADGAFEGVCEVNVAEGSHDFELIAEPRPLSISADLGERFFERLAASPVSQRELMWYVASTLPPSAQGDIAKRMLVSKPPGEATWLVRRAVGTFIASLPGGTPEREGIVLASLSSMDWMTISVGLLGARKLVGSEPYRSAVIELFNRPEVPVDVKWCALLYLSDAGVWDLGLVVASGLLETPWGQIDAWDQLRKVEELDGIRGGPRLDELLAVCAAGKRETESLASHMALLGVEVPEVLGDANIAIAQDPLARFLYQQSRRGDLATAAGKWLLSTLYGNWRGEVRANLEEFTYLVTPSDLRGSLSKAGALPYVGHRMAVVSDPYLVARRDLAEAVLVWAVVDPHPWVRRVAVELGGTKSVAAQALSHPTRHEVYPGWLDLMVAAGRAGAGLTDQGVIRQLTPGELRAVRRDIAPTLGLSTRETADSLERDR